MFVVFVVAATGQPAQPTVRFVFVLGEAGLCGLAVQVGWLVLLVGD